MGITIIICATLIYIITVLCYTKYKIHCSEEQDKYKNELNKLNGKLGWVEGAFVSIRNKIDFIFTDIKELRQIINEKISNNERSRGE